MGKFRGKSKLKSNRFDPLNVSAHKKDHKKPEPAGLKVIYQELCSQQPSDHLRGLERLGGIASDGEEPVTAILQFAGPDTAGCGALVRCLTNFLQNHDHHITLAAVGALRNLSASGNEEHVLQLLQCNVGVVLCNLLQSFSSLPATTDAAVLKERYDVLEQAAYLLYNLCEVHGEIVQTSGPALSGVLLQHSSASPSSHLLPPSLTLAANTALLCLTEDNPQVCSAVEQHATKLGAELAAAAASSELDPMVLHSALAVAGILTNLGLCELHLHNTITLISRALSVSPAQLLQQYSSVDTSDASSSDSGSEVLSAAMQEAADHKQMILQQAKLESFVLAGDSPSEGVAANDDSNTEPKAEGASTDDEGVEEMVMQLENGGSSRTDNGAVSASGWTALQHSLGAQQLALELLNNICIGDDDDDSTCGNVVRPGEVKWDDEKDDMVTPMGEDEGEDCDWEGLSSNKDEVLQPLLLQQQLFDRVLHCLQTADADVMSALQLSKYFQEIQDLVCGVQVRSLTTLQAVLDCLTLEQLGGPERLFSCWTQLGKLAFNDAASQGNAAVLEGATGAMRAVVSKYTAKEAHHLAAITQDELQLLFLAGLSCSGPQVRCNLARLLRDLCCLIVEQGSLDSLVQQPMLGVLTDATEFLMKLAGNDTELWVTAEALDALMDLYSDDRTDKLALNCRVVDRLRHILNYFNARYKKEKKENKELQQHAVLLTVKTNLPQFIRYKEPRVLNVDPAKEHACKGTGKTKSKKERRK